MASAWQQAWSLVTQAAAQRTVYGVDPILTLYKSPGLIGAARMLTSTCPCATAERPPRQMSDAPGDSAYATQMQHARTSPQSSCLGVASVPISSTSDGAPRALQVTCGRPPVTGEQAGTSESVSSAMPPSLAPGCLVLPHELGPGMGMRPPGRP